MFDLAKELNEQQYAAAAHVEGPLLVIAGAGSGKTRVITYRIANLVQYHGVKPWRIFAVTFTNKAAKEMKERVEQILGGYGAQCWISTFHSSCARLLRKFGEFAGVDPKFTIYDDSDQKAMVTRCVKEAGLNDKQFPPRAIQNEINRAKRELIGPNEYPAGDFYRERVRMVYEIYDKKMKAASALDFGDLLYRTVRGMKENPAMAGEIGQLFDFILVDEFQDTNHVQLEFVRQLAGAHNNVCVVGDDDQSIYSWRGANVRNIIDFEKSFPGARVVTLDRNYRSTANILEAAHGVVQKLTTRRPKELWTESAAGDPITFLESPTERDEAWNVAKAVQELRLDGIPLKEQAIFYRTNAQSRVLEEIMRTKQIPYRVVGGMKFYERAEVKDILGYLRLIQNPADLAAFLRVVNTPTRGIGKTTVDRLVALAAERDISAFDAIPHAVSGGIGTAAAGKLFKFREMVQGWIDEIEEGPARVATRVMEDTGYLTGLERENSPEADARMENLKELLGSIHDFESDAEEPTLDSFLELVALQTDVDAAKFDGEEVTLMTVHAAKGLEFDVVHVTGMEDGLFPIVSPGARLDASPEEMEEERRLCYVALTRARKKLFLNRARCRRLYGQERYNPPSRFLSDINADLIRDLTPAPVSFERVGGPSDWSQSQSQSRSQAPSRPSYGATPARPARPAVGGANSPLRRPAAATGANKPAAPSQSDIWVDPSFDQTATSMIQVGQSVRNPRYGVGKVVCVHPGNPPKVDVQFPGYGTKRIRSDFLESA